MGILKLEKDGAENKQGYNGPLQGADIANFTIFYRIRKKQLDATGIDVYSH